jgi:hypothetical protein
VARSSRPIRNPVAKKRGDFIAPLTAPVAVRVQCVRREQVDQRLDFTVIEMISKRRVQFLDSEADIECIAPG